MKPIRSMAWLVLGLCAGSLTTGVRDTKVNACWLEIPGNPGEGTSLAPAPVESRESK